MLGFRALGVQALGGGQANQTGRPDSVGSGIVGGHFSRGRWRTIREQLAAERRRRRKQREAERRERRRIEEEAERAKVAALRAEVAARHQAVIDALAKQVGATTPGEALQRILAEEADEEEAVVRLLLL
jgi:hypothetical protein